MLGNITLIGFNSNAQFYVKNGKSFYKTKQRDTELKGNPLDELKYLMNKWQAPKYKELPFFTGGVVGYFGYDMVQYVEKINFQNEDELNVADIKLMFFDYVIAFDYNRKKVFLITNIDGEVRNLEENYENAKRALQEIVTLMKTPCSVKVPRAQANFKIESNTTKEQFMKMVEKAISYIKAGDIFQVVPSQRFKVDLPIDLLEVYRKLKMINPSPYMYIMGFDDLSLVGASPETLVKVDEGRVMTMPIAGTCPRGKTKEEDKKLEENLLKDPKERAEHNMLVDLARNDIGKISKIDTVKVTEYMTLQKFSHVMHITSKVEGHLLEGLTGVDVVKAILPAGTLSGAPKVRAMEIIEELENQKRGIYGGAIGYIGYDNSLDTCIAIRTIVKKDGVAYIQAGGGVVFDSVPEKEYEESMNKAMALFEAIRKVREEI